MRPLRETSQSPLARDLLGAAREYRVSPEARRRTLAAMGVAGGLVVGTTAAHAAKAGGLAKVGTGISTVGAIKGIVAVAIVAGVGGGIGEYSRRSGEAAPAAVTSSVAVVSVSAPSISAPAHARVEVPDSTLPEVVVRPSPSVAAPPPTPSAVPSLVDEIAAIDRARVALSGRDPHSALRALDDHAHKFPRGVLGPEAVVLRVEALVQRGDRASALALAKAAAARDPNGPRTARMKTILGVDLP